MLMGSLETGVPIRKDPYSHPLLRSSTRPRPRSKFSRFLLFKRLDYLQWICTIGVFLFFVVLFQMFLPGSVMDKSEFSKKDNKDDSDLVYLRETGGFDFGDGIRFEGSKVLERFRRKNRREVNLTSSSAGYNVALRRFGYRKPQLALVFGDLLADPQQLLMVTVGAALREIGYEIQVYSLKDGPVHAVWNNLGAQVSVIGSNENAVTAVDWLNYNGIIINSLGAESVFTCFLQEPFQSLPLFWTIHDGALAVRLRDYNSSGHIELINSWKKLFSRASAVVFPNYALPMAFTAFDKGNFIVIPGSPTEVWEADALATLQNDNLRSQIGLGPDHVVITIVGSHFMYKGLWLEHALVLKALLPLLAEFPSDNGSDSFLRIIVLSGNSVGNYSIAVEAVARNLGYPGDIVENKPVEDASGILSTSNLVIYGSFLEEQSFPEILLKAMCLGKPIVAPKLSMIMKYVDDRVSGYLFPKDNLNMLTEIVRHVFSRGKLSPLACNIASIGKSIARNLMAAEAVDGYSSLLEIVLKLPSEVAQPKAVAEISPQSKQAWKWDLFEAVPKPTPYNRTSRSYNFLYKVEEMWDHTQRDSFTNPTALDDSFSYTIWEEEKNFQAVRIRKKREEDELKGRTDQTHGTWEDVYKTAKRVDRSRNDLHERDERELERTGQPLCIYEPFLGEGTWPFLHTTSLYRGIGLSSKRRRPGGDDIDAPSRIPLLNNPYYRDVLGDYGAYFAIANRIDRIHKNSWIGFQSWRATARKASLTKIAERALLDNIEKRRHGDALYFWVRMDMDPRNHLQQDFWSFCDSINAGNCRFAFSEALKKMYGLKGNLDALPPMPMDGNTWSVMQSWALPTRSFVEFVMFSRMFVDALDAQIYDEHHVSGYCYLSLSKDKHCYSRVLELLINVWAYHSARRMVYVNPDTGATQEQHKLQDRRRKMRIKWFNYATLKSMDEEYAEEYDSEHPKRRWLWPSTGEVFCQSVLERERNQRHKQKEKRKRQSRAKLDRMKQRARQKVIGKYIKPPPEEETDNSNSTTVTNKTSIL